MEWVSRRLEWVQVESYPGSDFLATRVSQGDGDKQRDQVWTSLWSWGEPTAHVTGQGFESTPIAE